MTHDTQCAMRTLAAFLTVGVTSRSASARVPHLPASDARTNGGDNGSVPTKTAISVCRVHDSGGGETAKTSTDEAKCAAR